MLIALLSLVISQQPVGNYLTRPEYQTYAAKTFYVNPDGGSDAYPCTSALQPCATPSAIPAKLPRLLRHNVVVNTTGTTTFTAPILFDGVEMDDNISVTFQGDTTWPTWTPPTGNVSGTLTGVTTLTFPAKYILTDSTQSWPAFGLTANSLAMRGRFVCFTSGTGNGGKYPIVSHTATTLELAVVPSPAPTAGTGYSLCSPGTTWTIPVAVAQAAWIRTGTGLYNFNDIYISGLGPNTSSGAVIRIGNAVASVKPTMSSVTLTRVRMYDVNDFVAYVQNSGAGNLLISASSLVGRTAVGDGSSGSTQIIAMNSTGAPGANRLSISGGTYLRSMRNVMSASSTTAAIQNVAMDTENITANVAAEFSNAQVTLQNTWLFNSAPNQTNTSGLIARNGTTLSITSLSIDGHIRGLDFAYFGGQSRTRTFGGALFSSTSLTAQLVISNNSLPSAAGVFLDTGTVVNWAGTYTATGMADGGRAWVCPDGVEAYTDAQVTGAAGALVQCGGATIRR